MKTLMVGGVGVAAVVLLGGCGLIPDKEIRDERTLTGAITTVTVTGGSGAVAVSGSSDGSVHVKRHVRYSGANPGPTDSVRGDHLVRKVPGARADSGLGGAPHHRAQRQRDRHRNGRLTARCQALIVPVDS